MRTYPGAASAALAPVLTGPPRPVSVVAVTPVAVYLRTGHPGCPALCLAVPGAVQVPCGLLVGGAPLLAGALAGLPVGAVGTAGRGGLTVGGLAVRVGRWWRPPRPVLRGSGLRARADRLPPVGALLGRGAGLTPYGDDVLAGALVALAAVGAPAAGALAREVLAGAFARTTFVSAALLWHAARGECLPELAAFLVALAGGDRAAVTGASGALRAVGHSSGAGMLAGATLVLARPGLDAGGGL
jgi:Protein of unknown function (DUF2877)